MAILEKRIYNQIEWHLHHAKTLIWQAKATAYATRADVLESGVSAPASGIGGGKRRMPGDRTGRAAMRIVAADEQVEEAILWVSVMQELRAQFDGRPEYTLFIGYYGAYISVTDYATATCCDRQTVNNYRDKIVVACALLAAESGLIKIREETPNVTA